MSLDGPKPVESNNSSLVGEKSTPPDIRIEKELLPDGIPQITHSIKQRRVLQKEITPDIYAVEKIIPQQEPTLIHISVDDIEATGGDPIQVLERELGLFGFQKNEEITTPQMNGQPAIFYQNGDTVIGYAPGEDGNLLGNEFMIFNIQNPNDIDYIKSGNILEKLTQLL